MPREIPFTPRKQSSVKGASIYPFPDMYVGDFFMAPRNGERFGFKDKVQMRVSRAAYNWTTRNKPHWQFTVRIADDQFVICTRVK